MHISGLRLAGQKDEHAKVNIKIFLKMREEVELILKPKRETDKMPVRQKRKVAQKSFSKKM